MKWFYGFLILMCFSRFQCEEAGYVCVPSPCSYTATVKDLTGLDGCGFVLELADGSRLIPQRLTYIQPPDKNEDPAYSFEFKEGQKVCFDYRETEGADICMAGKLVFLTCLQVCDPKNQPD